MEYYAKVGMWENQVCVMMDAEAYEVVVSAGTGCKVNLELELCEDKLLIGITPSHDGILTVSAASRQSLPYFVRSRCLHFSADVCERLSRSMVMGFELSGTRRSLSGEVDLAPHLRPWPKLRPNKMFDVGERMVEVYKERIMSTAQAGDEWELPPKDFMLRCPKGFMDIWNSMPTGITLKMGKGQQHVR